MPSMFWSGTAPGKSAQSPTGIASTLGDDICRDNKADVGRFACAGGNASLSKFAYLAR